MFDKEFYPTLSSTAELMGIDCLDRVVYEPHAGKADLVDFMHLKGARQILASEKHPDLYKIVDSREWVTMVGKDFFEVTPEDISHVEMIVMNPPFSNADEHIYHAWEIAPPGCKIISLCNWTLFDRDKMTKKKARVLALVRGQGGEKKNLGDVFSTAERKTNIDVGLVTLQKPMKKGMEFSGFFMDEEERPNYTEEGLMQFDEVRALVERYVAALKQFQVMDEEMSKLNVYTSPVGMTSGSFQISHNESVSSLDEFSKKLQKKSWNYIFGIMNLNKYVTSSVKENINKFVEQQEKVPFTERNIHVMLDTIFQNRQSLIKDSLVETVDRFTKYTKENRYDIEGWKTNSGHMLNKKFIVGWVIDSLDAKYGQTRIGYNCQDAQKLTDLTKVMCNLIGEDFDKVIIPEEDLYKPDSEQRKTRVYTELYEWCRFLTQDKSIWEGEVRSLKTNHWYDWGFFNIKFFKKGSAHIKFKDVKHWELLNRTYAEIKGEDLPEKF